MKTDKLNDWLGVITNIGIIIGLVLVGYEINQNSIELERESRISEIEVLDGVRGAWQNWGMAIIENEDVADIWVRGNAGEDLDRVEAVRYQRLADEMFRLIQQNYFQYTTLSGEQADWAVAQLARTTSLGPGLKSEFLRQLAEKKSDFIDRVRELDPPELHSRSEAE